MFNCGSLLRSGEFANVYGRIRKEKHFSFSRAQQRNGMMMKVAPYRHRVRLALIRFDWIQEKRESGATVIIVDVVISIGGRTLNLWQSTETERRGRRDATRELSGCQVCLLVGWKEGWFTCVVGICFFIARRRRGRGECGRVDSVDWHCHSARRKDVGTIMLPECVGRSGGGGWSLHKFKVAMTIG